MEINNSALNNSTSAAYKSPTTLKLEKKLEILGETADNKTTKEEIVDGFVKKPVSNSTTDYSTYSKPSQKTVSALIQDAERQTENFKKMIYDMLAKQDGSAQIVNGKLKVSAEVAAKAKASISDGGEYSVDSVATRIMDMAKALAGGDSSKLETLRGAVEKGFGAAAGKMGGKLTDISSRTYDEVMKRFDEWENSFKTTQTEVE